jgi:anti-sigma B factor antagonist
MTNGANGFSVQTRTEGNAQVIAIEGEVDLKTSPQLRDELLEVVGQAPEKIVVDLSQVRYMDSSGVGTIVEAKRRADSNGATILLAGLQPRVRSVFEITQLDKFFTICDSVDDALKQ